MVGSLHDVGHVEGRISNGREIADPRLCAERWDRPACAVPLWSESGGTQPRQRAGSTGRKRRRVVSNTTRAPAAAIAVAPISQVAGRCDCCSRSSPKNANDS